MTMISSIPAKGEGNAARSTRIWSIQAERNLAVDEYIVDPSRTMKEKSKRQLTKTFLEQRLLPSDYGRSELKDPVAGSL